MNKSYEPWHFLVSFWLYWSKTKKWDSGSSANYHLKYNLHTAILTLYFRAPEDEIWKYVDFIPLQDQLEGIKVFIKRQECEEQKKMSVL